MKNPTKPDTLVGFDGQSLVLLLPRLPAERYPHRPLRLDFLQAGVQALNNLHPPGAGNAHDVGLALAQ